MNYVAVIEMARPHPIITASVATAVTGRARTAIYQAFEQLKAAGGYTGAPSPSLAVTEVGKLRACWT
jgi:hypothetical protein